MKKKPLRLLPEAIKQLTQKPATSKYPFEKAKVYPNFRARILFESEKCIGCKMCMRVCPSKAIEIIISDNQPAAQTGPDGNPIPQKKKFDCIMNLDRCIYCAQCVDICPKKALKSSEDFELAQLDRTKLKLHYK
ncbi:MAG: 4Fe-4S binding protein [Elusimicrobiales bacterium]|nr:4Fe-4S binding protein [Elusimicrobiales bacterium]